MPAAKNARFFKVFQPQFSSLKLRIPAEFQNRVRGKMPRKVILRNSQGKLWPIEVVQRGDSGLWMQAGWSKFVQDHSLSFGEFLVFEFNGHHIFDVIVLGIHGCEKELLAPDNAEFLSNNVADDEYNSENGDFDHGRSDYDGDSADHDYMEDHDDNDEVEGMAYFGDDVDEEEMEMDTRKRNKVSGNNYSEGRSNRKVVAEDNPPVYTTKLTRSTLSKLWIPKNVMEEFELKFGDRVMLEDSKGKEWVGKISLWRTGKVIIDQGWDSLCGRHNARKGDTVICEFMSSTTHICQRIKVHFIKA